MEQVLIVDDDPKVLELLSEMVSGMGYGVAYVPRGEFALQRLNEQAFDLVLLDINLPGINGFEVLQKIKSTPDLREIPVIMITAGGDDKLLAKCLDLGASDYIDKPINETVLKARMASVLTILKHIREIESQKGQLLEKSHEIDKKNQDITDSLHYASLIQKSILPTELHLKDYSDKYFVLYMPKDIISGDFYWFRQREQKIYFVVVDCTGHGVPGAMLSVIGGIGLYRAVNDYHYNKPEEIIVHLHEVLVQTLQKNHHQKSLSDGMDLGICVVDLESGVLRYSGAKNPLIRFRDNQPEIFKGDRVSVGLVGDIKVESLTTHEMEIKPGDKFYMSTDGFVDQFGGERDKKLKTAGLLDLLRFANQKAIPITEQGKFLKQRFLEWKESEEQVDDVCLLGFEI